MSSTTTSSARRLQEERFDLKCNAKALFEQSETYRFYDDCLGALSKVSGGVAAGVLALEKMSLPLPKFLRRALPYFVLCSAICLPLYSHFHYAERSRSYRSAGVEYNDAARRVQAAIGGNQKRSAEDEDKLWEVLQERRFEIEKKMVFPVPNRILSYVQAEWFSRKVKGAGRPPFWIKYYVSNAWKQSISENKIKFMEEHSSKNM